MRKDSTLKKRTTHKTAGESKPGVLKLSRKSEGLRLQDQARDQAEYTVTVADAPEGDKLGARVVLALTAPGLSDETGDAIEMAVKLLCEVTNTDIRDIPVAEAMVIQAYAHITDGMTRDEAEATQRLGELVMLLDDAANGRPSPMPRSSTEEETNRQRLARNLTAIIANPETPRRLYDALADELTELQNIRDNSERRGWYTEGFIADCLEAYAEQKGGAR